MKKKNLIILLALPFLIALLCVVTAKTTDNTIDVDISFIEWNYDDMEAFKISTKLYNLSAVAVTQRDYKVKDGGNLKWTVANKDGSNTPHAEVVYKSGRYYLRAVSAGEVVLTCSNVKGTVQRSFTAVIYEENAILFYPAVSSSGVSIDSTVYYGEYDGKEGNAAVIDMKLVSVPATVNLNIEATTSPNVSFDTKTGKITINEPGEAYVTVYSASTDAQPITYSFTVVDEGVNVYTYEDLIYCSKDGEGHIAVLRKNFESLENAYELDATGKPVVDNGELKKRYNNTECFGNYDPKTGKFSFEDEIFVFPTTYNAEFINEWNNFCNTDDRYSELSADVKAGLHIRHDFYGNGYTVNLHNLTYPYLYADQLVDKAQVKIPQLSDDNLFRGPLALYSLGDPNNLPLVSLYGQDNIGMYVDGDNITVNNVNLKNCDFGNRLANLATVGTVLEVNGKNVVVKNSIISNGKNVIRSFSSENLTIDNCILSYAMNFLFLTGANEYVRIDFDSVAQFTQLDGTTAQAVIGQYLAAGAPGGSALDSFLVDSFDTQEERDAMRRALESVQKALSDSKVAEQYKGSTTLINTYFYSSGVASIGMESLFNTPFLNSSSLALIAEILASENEEGKSLIPYLSTGVAGVSYPVSVSIMDNTRFYDYKSTDSIDFSGLLTENASVVANALGLFEDDINIDDVLPLKDMLLNKSSSYIMNDSTTEKQYINIPVMYFGGLNLSRVEFIAARDDEFDMTEDYEEDFVDDDATEDNDAADAVVNSHYSSQIQINLLDAYLSDQLNEPGVVFDDMGNLVLKSVAVVTGFEPWRFIVVSDGYLYGEYPKIADLIANAN